MSRTCAPCRRRRGSRSRRAPSRSACFIWPLSERPARSSSARSPAPRSSLHEREGAPASAPSGAATKTSAPGSRLGLVEREQDPLDPRRPAAAGGRRAAERLDQAVVAPAAAERPRLGVERLGLELEHGARVVVETADQRPVELVGDAGLVEQACAPRRSARRRPGRGGRPCAARRPSPPGCPRPWSRRRAAGSRRCARARRRRARPRARAGRRAAPRGRRRASRRVPRLDSRRRRPGTPSPRSRSSSSMISSASTSGDSEPITSASSWWNWRKRPACGRSWRKNGPELPEP